MESEKRKRKCIVIVQTQFGRVKEISTLGQYQKLKKLLKAHSPEITFVKMDAHIKELNADKIVRIELPNDLGLVLKRTWNS